MSARPSSTAGLTSTRGFPAATRHSRERALLIRRAPGVRAQVGGRDVHRFEAQRLPEGEHPLQPDTKAGDRARGLPVLELVVGQEGNEHVVVRGRGGEAMGQPEQEAAGQDAGRCREGHTPSQASVRLASAQASRTRAPKGVTRYIRRGRPIAPGPLASGCELT